MSLEARYTCSVQKCAEYQASVSAWESEYHSVHHDLHMHRQAEKQGSIEQGALEEQLYILKFSLNKCSRDSIKAVEALLAKN